MSDTLFDIEPVKHYFSDYNKPVCRDCGKSMKRWGLEGGSGSELGKNWYTLCNSCLNARDEARRSS